MPQPLDVGGYGKRWRWDDLSESCQRPVMFLSDSFLKTKKRETLSHLKNKQTKKKKNQNAAMVVGHLLRTVTLYCVVKIKTEMLGCLLSSMLMLQLHYVCIKV